ncbi:Uncharacterized protein HZ326_23876 [Fusarium oxysporum f. sp. albedinis]|nr:Uncharacterized protein HZ326_23876 [Fusarium oxysporum f. sp. albedinis]
MLNNNKSGNNIPATRLSSAGRRAPSQSRQTNLPSGALQPGAKQLSKFNGEFSACSCGSGMCVPWLLENEKSHWSSSGLATPQRTFCSAAHSRPETQAGVDVGTQSYGAALAISWTPIPQVSEPLFLIVLSA